MERYNPFRLIQFWLSGVRRMTHKMPQDDYDNVYKIILLGDATVGKSFLSVDRLCIQSYVGVV